MLKDVIFFTNGNVMVFDEDGEQIPELQGFIKNEIGSFVFAQFRFFNNIANPKREGEA